MAEKQDNGPKNDKQFDPDERFRYIGFEVHPGKINDLFKSDSEKESWVKKIREKRKKGFRLRDETSFDAPRVSSYERIVLTITSLVLIASLFLPWFSGYKEYEVEAKAASSLPPIELVGDSAAVSIGDSAGIALGTEGQPVSTDMNVAAEGVQTTNEMETSGTMGGEKDERGFSSITGAIKRKEYRKEHLSASAIGALGALGMVFSSGFVLKITGLLLLIYMLLCLGIAGTILYALYGIKGDQDTVALKLKKLLKFGWIPVGIWAACLILSFFGASYSFDTSDMMKQIGSSYGIGTYLGILSYGFYISLACFIMSAAKAVEI